MTNDKRETVENIKNNWAQSYKDNPGQTRETVRAMLRKSPRNVRLVEKAISGRARRFMLKKAGALSVIEDELAAAKKYHAENE